MQDDKGFCIYEAFKTINLYKKLPYLNLFLLTNIFIINLEFNSALFTDKNNLIIFISALIINSFLAFRIWNSKKTLLLLLVRIINWATLVIITFFDSTGFIYFVFLLNIINSNYYYDSFKKQLLFTSFLSFLYLSGSVLRIEQVDIRFIVLLYGVIFNFVFSYFFHIFKENKRKNDELRKLLSKIIEKAPYGIQFIDAKGNTKIFNPALKKIYHLTDEEIYNKPDWQLFYNKQKYDKKGRYTSLITETLETGKVFRDKEKLFINKNGKEEYYLVDTYPLEDEKGKLIGVLGMYDNITEQKEIERQLLDAHYEMIKLAVTDDLTKVYNVRYFKQRLNEEFAKAYKNDLSLLIIDVDYFKNYNDLFGHQAGDKVLQRIALLIKENVRKTDIVARYGGEEFTVILPGMKKEKAIIVAERIRQAIREYEFPGEDKLPGGQLTVTIGLASMPDDAKSTNELIKIADDALYKGKNNKKDSVVVA